MLSLLGVNLLSMIFLKLQFWILKVLIIRRLILTKNCNNCYYLKFSEFLIDALQARDDHCGNHFSNCGCTKPDDVTEDDWQFFCYQISTRNKYDMAENNRFPLFKEGVRECLPMTRSQAVIQKDEKNNNAFFREQESFFIFQTKIKFTESSSTCTFIRKYSTLRDSVACGAQAPREMALKRHRVLWRTFSSVLYRVTFFILIKID